MKHLKVNDLPIIGMFTVIDIVNKKVLHSFDGEGKGDIPYDVATRDVIAFYASDDTLIIEVA